jgi:ATP-dependent protease HslVU (ClpYQ) peptidase subunit
VTTLIAYQGRDYCVIAADTQTTSNELKSDCSPMGKIALNGRFLVAAAGLVRGMNLIQHAFVPPSPARVKNLDKFMVASFIPSLRKTFSMSGYDIRAEGHPSSFENDFIVGVAGTLYFIDEVYGVEKTKDKVYCTGTGAELALGAADALGIDKAKTRLEVIAILTKAVKTAMKFDINSGGQVQIAIQSKDSETRITFTN